MAGIRWTEEAAVWLEDIYNYIARDNPQAAVKVVDSIYNKTRILKDYPKIGYHYNSVPEGEIRILLYGHYRIAYLVKEEKWVEILGVFHGALDISRYL